MELVQDRTRLSIPLLWFAQASEGDECSNAMGINKYHPHEAFSNYACARQITTFENKTNSCLEFTKSNSSPRSRLYCFLIHTTFAPVPTIHLMSLQFFNSSKDGPSIPCRTKFCVREPCESSCTSSLFTFHQSPLPDVEEMT
jgi:hypothetical protein